MEEDKKEKKNITEQEINEWFLSLDLEKKQGIFCFYDMFFNGGKRIANG